VRPPILVFLGGLRVYASRARAEAALAAAKPGALDAFDASGRQLRLAEGGRSWLGFRRRTGVRLEADAAHAADGQRLRARLLEALVSKGAPRPWAEGAPLGALVADAARRFGG
jgi:hypothetical protein